MNTTKIEAARFKVSDTPVKFQIAKYQDGRVCLQLITDDETQEPYCTLTVNVEEADWILDDNEILVKTWSENGPTAEVCLQLGLFIDTGRRIPTGYAKAQIWKVC